MWSQIARTVAKNEIARLTYLQDSQTFYVSRRWLNLQEYASKQLLQDHGLTVQKFIVVDSVESAKKQMPSFKADEYVVKAQILAGGRGKGHFTSGLQGGVKLTKKPDEVISYVEKMLGHRLITKQTGKEGALVSKVMVAESVNLTRETYLAILLDRDTGGPVVIGSPAGGVDIEEVAEKTPNLIYKEAVDINKGLTDDQALRLAQNLQFKGPLLKQVQQELKRLYDMFVKVDATQIEINPFSETDKQKVYCVDAKLNFDDSAEFRQKSVFSLNDHSEQDAREVEANVHKLNYIGLTGNIGCLVNGAGLAMATMDIIKLHGGQPANFLDVGGGVQEEQVFHAFRIITSDPQVKAILVNIFGGIVNCETIARGLTNAFRKMSLKVPLVVRLEGTNVDNARKILRESKLPIISATDLDDAAQKAVGCLA